MSKANMRFSNGMRRVLVVALIKLVYDFTTAQIP